jgi:outer membrane receptor protein involved in Fe transport
MRFFILSCFLFTTAFAQISNFSISGSIQDKASKAPMEYCTISLINAGDNSLVTGMVSDLSGNFTLDKLKPGKYSLEISFIGFEAKQLDNILLSKDNQNVQLGTIFLGSDATMVNEVEVTALKSSVRYELDKKIIDVDKNIAASNGTAVDILATVPSVQTDIDGNVSLRGSGGFQVFINGRPSVLDANDALRQIPASTIENIEIITNPSARYDAEGTAGIINIITKKKTDDGTSGIINVRGGTFKTYGSDASVSIKKKKFTYMFSGNYNHRERPGNYNSTFNTTLNDTTVSTINDGSKRQIFNNYNVKGGFEYRISDNQYIMVNYTYGGFKMIFDDEFDFGFINRTTEEGEFFTNTNRSTRQGPFHEVSLDYGYTFKNKSKLTAHVSANKRGFEEFVYNDRFDESGRNILGTVSNEVGPSQRVRINIDYVIPIKEHSKFELGAMSQLNKSNEENIAYNKDVLNGELVQDPQFYNDVVYKKNIRAFYGMFSSKWDKFSYQFGLRTENTLRDIEVLNTNTSFIVNRLDLFPSAHLSVDVNKQHQYFFSYSKRINRPRGWYLEPNAIFTDANTLFQGNPGLLPEYIHALESGWLFNFKKKGSWNNELYFRRELNVIQFVRVPLSYELTRQGPENIGISNAVGLESSLSLLPFKWWNTDLMANVFYFNLKGEFGEETFNTSSFSYILRWNNYFKIKKNTKIQFNTSYSSPIINAQGRESYTLRFDAGIRQDLFDGKLALGVQIGDLFNTYIDRSTLEGINFNSQRKNNPRGPSVQFSAGYKINNYKAKRSTYNDSGGEDF